jgi:hypothetical protein
MFTIEHEFDSTVITLIDEGHEGLPLKGDITISAFDDCVTLEQVHPTTQGEMTVASSPSRWRSCADLAAALNLPEGSYRLNQHKD